MRQRRLVRLATVLSALLATLLLTQILVAGEESPPASRTLHPGDNLIGWVGFATTPQALFDQIPEARLIYTWDADDARYRFSTPGFPATLSSIEPGMGLIVRIAGEQPVEWHQPTVADGEWVALKPGPNLVAWTGPSGTPIDLAVRSIGESFTHALYSRPESNELALHEAGSRTGPGLQHQLHRGDGLWVFNTTEASWLQPSGDRALHPLGPPPDHVRWYASFDKYLDADGIAVIATDNVADEALFRAAAIFEDMLVNRPDIRDTLVRRRVHIAIVGRSEQTFDLAPYRQYRDRIELRPWGEGGPRGLGPNDFTPTLIPEENLLCLADDAYRGHDVTVHEFAHAIDYALGHGPQAGSFQAALGSAYRSLVKTERWKGSYAARNVREFWAVSVSTWLGLDRSVRLQIKSSDDLQRYAPDVAELITSTLGDIRVDASCQAADAPVQGATRKHLVQGFLLTDDSVPVADVRGRIERQSDTPPPGQSANISEFPIWSDGRFARFTAPGDYLVSFHWEHCPLFYHEEGLTIAKSAAQVIAIGGSGVEINAHLPEHFCRQRFSGTIVDSAGNPVRLGIGVVRDLSDGVNLVGASLRSDADGRFAVRLPTTGRYRIYTHARGCWYSYNGHALVDYEADMYIDAERLDSQELKLTVPDRTCSE
ncbi:MAG: hypothetical protein OXG42_00610 [Chloroflexi bacterium]|nr:hypothetical protein [Chloroflexota bacterium]